MINLPSIHTLQLPLMRNQYGIRNSFMEAIPIFPQKIVFLGCAYFSNLPSFMLENTTVVMQTLRESNRILFQAVNHNKEYPLPRSAIGNSRSCTALSSKNFPTLVSTFSVVLSFQFPLQVMPKAIIYNGREYLPLPVSSQPNWGGRLLLETLHADGIHYEMRPG